jgi:serine/threonine protein kinase/formylglycine-generating enzyme required for sulfatase activity
MTDAWPESGDPNLCLGMLALEAGFIDREALVKAQQSWFLCRSHALGEVLERCGEITPEQHALLRNWVGQCLYLKDGVPPAVAETNRAPGNDRFPLSAGTRYRIQGVIACGGLGQVSLARDDVLGREVAVKEILDYLAADPAKRTRFLREAQITGGLEHPGVVPVYDLGQDGRGRLFYAMRRIDGITLRQALETYHASDHPPANRCVEFRTLLGHFITICKTVAYAHGRGVVHRDLKPDNIMLGPYGEALVLDWGLAKRLGETDSIGTDGLTERSAEDRLTRDGAAVGTPAFMSPEQARGDGPGVGPASDTYSLGATLYQMLTGRPPVEGGNVAEILQRVQHHDFPSPREVKPSAPAALAAICGKAMALDPVQRYSSPLLLAQDLEMWLADAPISAYREPWPARLRRWTRSHRGTVSVLVGLLLAGVVAMTLGAIAVVQERARDRATDLIDKLLVVAPEAVPGVIEQMAADHARVDPRLRQLLQHSDLTERNRARLRLALLGADPTLAARLRENLLDEASPEELMLLCDGLASCSDRRFDTLWAAAQAPEASSRRLRACAALARLDPNDARWAAIAPALARQLVDISPTQLAPWATLFTPARNHLIAPLTMLYHEHRRIDARMVAASLLADYAGDHPALLADLALDAGPRQYAILFPRLEGHREPVVAHMGRVLDRRLAPVWSDVPAASSWVEPDPTRMERAGITLAARFALCESLDLAEFDALAAELQRGGYRPLCFRPFRADKGVRVAAAWTRDGLPARTYHGRELAEATTLDAQWRAEGFLPHDVAVYQDRGVARHATLWVKGDPQLAEAVAFLDIARDERRDMDRRLEEAGYLLRTHLPGGDGRRADLRGIWWQLVRPADRWFHRDDLTAKQYDYWLSPSNLQLDVRLSAKEAAVPETRYSGCWRSGGAFESRGTLALSPDEHRTQTRTLAADGFRPCSISALELGGRTVIASVWHRPLVPLEEQTTLARRQAQAALTLIRLHSPRRAWPVFQLCPDPTARSFLVRDVVPFNVDLMALLERLHAEPDVSSRRALVLALGEFPVERLGEARRDAIERLLRQYQSEGDAGLHGALAWTLDRWGERSARAEIDRKLAGKPEETKSWYVSPGGATMVVQNGPMEYVMGSPNSEVGRSPGEHRHRQRVGHRWAIAAHEVTAQDFARCRQASGLKTTLPREPSVEPKGPALGLSWFDAARYCRWLSEQENVPETQMCYPPLAEIKDGMILPKDFLQRTGYRLPLEAEWEYSCRAGTEASRYFGAAEEGATPAWTIRKDFEGLGGYAWFLATAGGRSHRVGTLMPNDFGLFDMLGNAGEWCHNAGDAAASADELPEGERVIASRTARVLRGGSYLQGESAARCAARVLVGPHSRLAGNGLRVVRTLPPLPCP